MAISCSVCVAWIAYQDTASSVSYETIGVVAQIESTVLAGCIGAPLGMYGSEALLGAPLCVTGWGSAGVVTAFASLCGRMLWLGSTWFGCIASLGACMATCALAGV